MIHSHDFIPSDKPGYEMCTGCGSYHSIAQINPQELYEKDYWSHEAGHSKPKEQIWNLTETETCGISKVEKILEYVPQCNTVLEIGCYPGVLLNLLMRLRYEAYGIEPNPGYIQFIKDNCAGATLIEGYFPQVFKSDRQDVFDCIIGMDIFEHIDDYDTFTRAAHRLLKPSGTAIFMSPIIFDDGIVRERDFLPSEHCWIHTIQFLEPYLKSIFSGVKFDRWQEGHEMFIVKK